MNEYDRLKQQIPGEKHEYLGDAVYVSHDGYQLWLCTTDGISITNKVALEPLVYENLIKYVEFLKYES